MVIVAANGQQSGVRPMNTALRFRGRLDFRLSETLSRRSVASATGRAAPHRPGAYDDAPGTLDIDTDEIWSLRLSAMEARRALDEAFMARRLWS
jgi:hypothetical protein